jgi:hypothetical protein
MAEMMINCVFILHIKMIFHVVVVVWRYFCQKFTQKMPMRRRSKQQKKKRDDAVEDKPLDVIDIIQ